VRRRCGLASNYFDDLFRTFKGGVSRWTYGMADVDPDIRIVDWRCTGLNFSASTVFCRDCCPSCLRSCDYDRCWPLVRCYGRHLYIDTLRRIG